MYSGYAQDALRAQRPLHPPSHPAIYRLHVALCCVTYLRHARHAHDALHAQQPPHPPACTAAHPEGRGPFIQHNAGEPWHSTGDA
eukprot:1159025-Pelagomonas_calceolata.AAC.4